LLLCLLGLVLFNIGPIPAALAQDTDDLDARLRRLEERVDTLSSELEAAKEEAQAAKAEAQAAREEAVSGGTAAYAAPDPLSKWHLAGYAETSFVVQDRIEPDTSFAFGRFNPVLHYQYNDYVLFEGELAFSTDTAGATTTDLEYAAIDILAHDYVTVVAGKFLSPIGQFQERLHPPWINKLPDAPVGFGHGGIHTHGGVQPQSEVGVQLRGGVPLGSMIGSYSVFVGNGPRIEPGEVELEGFGTDDNDNKAFGGRIGLQLLPYLEVGASLMSAQLLGAAEEATGPVTEGDYTLWGVDGAFTKGAWDVRFEYLNAQLDSFFGAAHHDAATTELIPKTDWEAWYVQVAYQLSDLTDLPYLMNLEPVVRYGELDIEGFEEFVEHGAPERRWSVGLNYLFEPSVMVKLGMSWHDFREAEAEDSAEFTIQLAYGF
jgi:hypothetical protein